MLGRQALNRELVDMEALTREVLEELRRRLSDPARPRDELDYLERLLKRY